MMDSYGKFLGVMDNMEIIEGEDGEDE